MDATTLRVFGGKGLFLWPVIGEKEKTENILTVKHNPKR
jgi:hypothetical protein